MKVYWPDDTTITASGNGKRGVATVPADTTIASDGGTIYTPEITNPGEKGPEVTLRFMDGVTVSGLNILGPLYGRSAEDGPANKGGYAGRKAVEIGVRLEGTGIVIDQCNISGWIGAGVRLRNDSTATIHNCRISKQYNQDRGYGVSAIDNSRVRIDATRFDYNRHSIESGDTADWTVTNSVIGPHSVSHAIDAHPPAGGQYRMDRVAVKAWNALHIRQIPEIPAEFSRIWFPNARKQLVRQSDQRRVADGDGRGPTHRGTVIASAEGGLEDFRNIVFDQVSWSSSPPPWLNRSQPVEDSGQHGSSQPGAQQADEDDTPDRVPARSPVAADWPRRDTEPEERERIPIMSANRSDSEDGVPDGWG